MTKVVKTLIAVTLTANMCVLSADAQESPSLTPPSEEKQKLLNDFFDASGMNNTTKSNMNNAMTVIRGNMVKNIYLKLASDESLSKDERLEKAKNIVKKVMDNFYSRLDYQTEMRKILSSVWGKHFTEDDLKKMIAFLKTESAKKFTAKSTQMVLEGKNELKKRLKPMLDKKLKERLSKMRTAETEASTQ